MVREGAGRILVVDDEAMLRNLLREVLQGEGFEVREAGDGFEACSLAGDYRPDLILLDIMMPGMSGFQVASRLRDETSTREIPILMVTALDDRDSKRQAKQLGVKAVLTKPIDFAELICRVRQMLLPEPH